MLSKPEAFAQALNEGQSPQSTFRETAPMAGLPLGPPWPSQDTLLFPRETVLLDRRSFLKSLTSYHSPSSKHGPHSAHGRFS